MIPSFKNPLLLTKALTHRSALNEQLSESTESNERLEYLGDAVLELAVSDFLYHKYPAEPEGQLTAFRSSLVKTTTLAQAAQSLGLGEMIIMSKGEVGTGGRTNESLLANTFESVIGALYLDQGFAIVVNFLELHLFPKIDDVIAQKLYKDPKSLLQETVQGLGLPTPTYTVVSEVGPDHAKEFMIHVYIGDALKGTGSGKNKQAAQQDAAQNALKKYLS